MKQFLLSAIAIALFSCSGDDDSKPINYYQGSLVGTWVNTSYTPENSDHVYDTSTCENRDIKAIHSTYTFNTDLTFHLVDTCNGGSGVDGTYKYSNGQLLLKIGGDPATYKASIINNDVNKLQINIEGTGSFIFAKQP